jgi:YVTN family beta-propeller protein
MSIVRPSTLILLGCASGCHGGGHADDDPASVPIAPITSDAVFVVNGEDSSISVIEASSDEVVGTIRLSNVEYPHHVYLSSDRGTMLVAVPGIDLSGGHDGGHGAGHDAAGGAVLALDTTTGTLKAARRLDAPNHNAVFAPIGTIWTSQIASPGAVLILDPVTLSTTSTIQVGVDPAEVTFAASGSHAFVANTGSDTVSVFDPTGAPIRTISVGDAPVGAWPGTDGQMYVDNEAGKSLTVIDTTTIAVTRTIDLGFTPALAAVAPSGELWVTDTDTGKLVFLRAADGTRLGELITGAGAHAIAFSGDGAKAYVTNQTAGTVAVVDVQAKSVIKTVVVGAKPNGIVFRPRIPM